MTHIAATEELPGILGLFAYRPETAKPMCELAEVLLRGPSTLDAGERELIATYVSRLNGCEFCAAAHGTVAHLLLGDERGVMTAARPEGIASAVSPKLRALLTIAAAVQRGGRAVDERHIAAARRLGATDREVHDTVLIAAAFCMYNRYVDGLGTAVPADPRTYDDIARRIVSDGYTA
jgi:uncharacterized peroxidase-related enzyme